MNIEQPNIILIYSLIGFSYQFMKVSIKGCYLLGFDFY